MSANKTFRFDKEQTDIMYEIYGQILETLQLVDPKEFGNGPDRQSKIEQYCLDNIVLEDGKMDGGVFGKFIGSQYENDDLRKEAASGQLKAVLNKQDILPAVKMYLSQMAQDYIPYDTVLTAGAVIGQEDKSLQMGCGQGKTGVIAFATYEKISKGEQVFITSSTPILAAEALDTLEYYNNLGVADQLVLIGPDSITKAALDEHGKVLTYVDDHGNTKVQRETIDLKRPDKRRELSLAYQNAGIVVSDNGTLMQHAMASYLLPPEEGQVRSLLADEADYSLLDSYQIVEKTREYNEDQIQSKMVGRQKAYDIYEMVKGKLQDRAYNKDDDNQYVDFTAEGEKEVIALINELGGDVDKNEIFGMVYDALVVDTVYKENRDYQVLDDGKTIISENRASGAEMDLPQGIQQALEIKLTNEGRYSGEITEERDVLSVTNIQQFFSSMFSKGKTSFISGTLGLDSQEILQELSKNFRINFDDIYNIPPREESIRQDAGKTLFVNKAAKQEAIIANALEQARAGRPVLVGAVSETEINELKEMLQGEGTRVLEYTAASETIFQRDKAELGDDEFTAKYNVPKGAYKKYEDFIKVEAGKANTITLGTSIIGRGTTIKTSKDINEAGGIHVIVDGLHETSSRNQEQYLARTARGSNNGSTVEFFSLDDIPEAVRDEVLQEVTTAGVPHVGTHENQALAQKVYKTTYKHVDSRTSQIRANVVNLMQTVKDAQHAIQTEDISPKSKVEIYTLLSARAIQVQHRALGVSEQERFEEYQRQITAYQEMYVARAIHKEQGLDFDEKQYLIDRGLKDIADTYIPFGEKEEEKIFTAAGVAFLLRGERTTDDKGITEKSNDDNSNGVRFDGGKSNHGDSNGVRLSSVIEARNQTGEMVAESAKAKVVQAAVVNMSNNKNTQVKAEEGGR